MKKWIKGKIFQKIMKVHKIINYKISLPRKNLTMMKPCLSLIAISKKIKFHHLNNLRNRKYQPIISKIFNFRNLLVKILKIV